MFRKKVWIVVYFWVKVFMERLEEEKKERKNLDDIPVLLLIPCVASSFMRMTYYDLFILIRRLIIVEAFNVKK